MSYALGLLILIIVSVLAFWKPQPVIFMMNAGIAAMLGLYTPDALAGLGYSTYGVGMGLTLIIFSLLNLGFAASTLISPARGKNGNE